MRKRPGGTIRILAHCARCGHSPRDYAVRRVVAFLPGRHELAVCKYCDENHATTPTALEEHAMALDGEPIAEMHFVDSWHAEPGRVRRTAEFFLGAECYAELRPPPLEKRKVAEAEHEKWMERARAQQAAFRDGDDDDDDDGLGMRGGKNAWGDDVEEDW